ncbi:MAG: MmgE/PrpD family protein, partial [Acidimicrobiia bacterium]|nr:MmgE/PrpD family protein [Acidimicrobiia bacterium]
MPLQALAKGGTVGTVEFAEFISQTKYEDLPASAVAAIKSVIVDTLAVTVAGVAEPASEALSDLLSKYGGAPISTVIGRPFKTDPASAALLNGTAAHALDYDDYCFAMSGHPSAVILPPI